MADAELPNPTSAPFFIWLLSLFNYVGHNTFISSYMHVLFQTFSILLIFFQALILNQIIIKHKFFHGSSYLPAFFYVILMSLFAEFVTLNEVLIANTFLLFALEKLFVISKKERPLVQIFDTGILLSIASLFYLPSIFFFLHFFVIIALLRTFVWREWIIGLSGIIIPHFLVGTYFFLTDQLPLFIEYHITDQIRLSTFELRYNAIMLASAGLVLLLVLLASFMVQASFLRSVVQIRNYFVIVFWSLIISILSILIQPDYKMTHYILLAIPVSILLGYYFGELRSHLLAEILATSLLLLVCANHYLHLII